MFTTTIRPTSTDRRSSRKVRPSRRVSLAGIESLEGRQLMTTIPTFATVSATSVVASVSTAPMEQTTVQGVMDNRGGAVVGVPMTAGQILDVTDQVSYYRQNGSKPTAASSMYVTDPNGHFIGNVFSGSNNMAEQTFRASMSGTYQVHFWSTYSLPQQLDSSAINYDFVYAANIRPITMDPTTDAHLDPNHNAADAAKLSYSGGGLNAFLEADGKTLDLTGPTGRAIQLRGNWQTTTASDGSATFTASNSVGLVSALGTINLPLTSLGSVVVTTKPNANGNTLFGEVKTVGLAIAGMPITSLMSSVGSAFSFTSNLPSVTGGSATTPGYSWGIALGDSLVGSGGKLNDQNAPVNPAVPYLYFTTNSGIGYTYGQVNVSAGSSSYAVDAVIDPTDPSFYFHISGTPVVSDLAIGGSLNDLMPFTPTNTITSWNRTNFYGDFYVKGQLNIGDLTDDTVPLLLDGGIMFNFDPTHSGLLETAKHDTNDLSRVISTHASSAALAALGHDLTGIQIGSNAQLSLGINQDGISITVPLTQSSFVWDGPANSAFFHEQTAQLFQGTAVANILPTGSLAWDGYFNLSNGEFQMQGIGTYSLLGQQVANGWLDFSSDGIGMGGEISFDKTVNVGSLATEVDLDAGINIHIGANGMGSVSIYGSLGASATSSGKVLNSFAHDLNYKSGQVNIRQQAQSIFDSMIPTPATLAQQVIQPITTEWNNLLKKAQNAGSTAINYLKGLFS